MFEANAPKYTMRNVRCRKAERAVPVDMGLSPSTTASSISSREMSRSFPPSRGSDGTPASYGTGSRDRSREEACVRTVEMRRASSGSTNVALAPVQPEWRRCQRSPVKSRHCPATVMPPRGDVSGRLNLRQRNRTSEEGRFVGHPVRVPQRAHFVLREAMEDERMSLSPRRPVITAARGPVIAVGTAADAPARAPAPAPWEAGTMRTGASLDARCRPARPIRTAALCGCSRPSST
jgi:hypothetical protein